MCIINYKFCVRYDSGEYSCRGSNEAGFGDTSPGVSLTVQCKYICICKYINKQGIF